MAKTPTNLAPENISWYMYDVTLYAEDQFKLPPILEKILHRLRETGLRLSLEKNPFFISLLYDTKFQSRETQYLTEFWTQYVRTSYLRMCSILGNIGNYVITCESICLIMYL